MNYSNQIPTQVIITQDKLVDLLLQAATREDIAKLANQSKLDCAEPRNKFKEAYLEMKRSNNAMKARMDRQFESARIHYDRQFLKIDQRYNWIIGIVLATGLNPCRDDSERRSLALKHL